MLEFYYENNIDYRKLVNFEVYSFEKEPAKLFSWVPDEASQKMERPGSVEPNVPLGQRRPKVLVPLGAGKDSIVVYELLKEAGADCIWFFLEADYSVFFFYCFPF